MHTKVYLEPMQSFWEHITGNEAELRRIENYWRLYGGWTVVKRACIDGIRQEIIRRRGENWWDLSLFV